MISKKTHGFCKVYYYKNPDTYHQYKLQGKTVTQRLSWAHTHIAKRSTVKSSSIVVGKWEDGYALFNKETGGRLWCERIGQRRIRWFEEEVIRPRMEDMPEIRQYDQ